MAQALIAFLFLALTWFMVRTLWKIDDNQTTLFNRMNGLETEFYTLKGQHEAISGKCKT